MIFPIPNPAAHFARRSAFAARKLAHAAGQGQAAAFLVLYQQQARQAHGHLAAGAGMTAAMEAPERNTKLSIIGSTPTGNLIQRKCCLFISLFHIGNRVFSD